MAASISLKVKGIQGVNAFGAKGQALGGLKLGGLPAATGKGVALKMSGIGGDYGAAAAKAAAAKAAPVKAAAVTASAACPGAATCGTIWKGTGLSLGLGLGLGAWGPVLALGTLGLVGAGAYLHRRNRKLGRRCPGR